MRPWHNYQKVRSFISWWFRNRSAQASRVALANRDYLQIGCGPQIAPGYVNLDYRWVPGIDIVWDINRKLPFPSERFIGVFSEHCLEHFPDSTLRFVLSEIHRVVRPGGRVRIVVPSLEIHAQRYLATRDGNDESPAVTINQVFYSGHDWMSRSRWLNDGHQFVHDFVTLSNRLYAAGFKTVTNESFGHGADQRLLIDRADRAWESLYVEAVKSSQLA